MSQKKGGLKNLRKNRLQPFRVRELLNVREKILLKVIFFVTSRLGRSMSLVSQNRA